MSVCRHDYHLFIMNVFEKIAAENKVPTKTVMDGCFIDGFEPLLTIVYEKINEKLPDNDDVIFCCPKCGSFDLVTEKFAASQSLY